MQLPLIILGAGGHAKVLVDLITEIGLHIEAIVAISPPSNSIFENIKVLRDDSAILSYERTSVKLVVGIGSVGVVNQRKKLFNFYAEKGYTFATLTHPSAVISRYSSIDQGAQIMAGAVVQAGCVIGVNSIINTRASIDHDCIIGDHVHIAPGVTLSGSVTIGNGCHIGTGATIIQGITVGEMVTVGAGAVVTKNIADGAMVKGVPAR